MKSSRIGFSNSSILILLMCFFWINVSKAQNADAVVAQIVKEANDNSQLENLAQELLDGIGPRLVGTPQMKKAHDWAVAKYEGWNIQAKNEQWGQWRGWERGVSHIDMVYPRLKSLEGTQLAWSPGTKGKNVIGETVILPDLADSIAFKAWVKTIKDKFVLISMNQPTGRPDENWKEYATTASFEKMKADRTAQTNAWRLRIEKTGLTMKTLPKVLEQNGALGVITCNWSAGFGVNKIFGANTTKVPSIDIALEDYGLLYRLTASGAKPKISVKAESKELGMVPTYNTLAEVKGVEKPDEYVMLSAHFDSWDGGAGATDNGTGTLTMLEAMRILKKVYPNPKRSILVGHWGSEEQGLNGSRAFVEDHPEIVDKLQAMFNQDNGTGRVVSLMGQGFLNSYDYLSRWLAKVPSAIKDQIVTSFPGAPSTGGSDYASFVAAGAPAFSLSSTSWDYGNYTWHTNRDTYDKIIFDDVKSNAILTAILVYMACEDPNFTSREKIVLPADANGKPGAWPKQVKPNRKGGLN